MATAKKTDTATQEVIVNQVGDVTERTFVPQGIDAVPVNPLSELPAEFKALADAYPSAIGFTEEGSTVALHF